MFGDVGLDYDSCMRDPLGALGVSNMIEQFVRHAPRVPTRPPERHLRICANPHCKSGHYKKGPYCSAECNRQATQLLLTT